MAYAIDGAEGIDEGCMETVRKYWNAFTAAWRRANPESPEIPHGVVRSVTNVCTNLDTSTAVNISIVYQGPSGRRDWVDRV